MFLCIVLPGLIMNSS